MFTSIDDVSACAEQILDLWKLGWSSVEDEANTCKQLGEDLYFLYQNLSRLISVFKRVGDSSDNPIPRNSQFYDVSALTTILDDPVATITDLKVILQGEFRGKSMTIEMVWGISGSPEIARIHYKIRRHNLLIPTLLKPLEIKLFLDIKTLVQGYGEVILEESTTLESRILNNSPTPSTVPGKVTRCDQIQIPDFIKLKFEQISKFGRPELTPLYDIPIAHCIEAVLLHQDDHFVKLEAPFSRDSNPEAIKSAKNYLRVMKMVWIIHYIQALLEYKVAYISEHHLLKYFVEDLSGRCVEKYNQDAWYINRSWSLDQRMFEQQIWTSIADDAFLIWPGDITTIDPFERLLQNGAENVVLRTKLSPPGPNVLKELVLLRKGEELLELITREAYHSKLLDTMYSQSKRLINLRTVSLYPTFSDFDDTSWDMKLSIRASGNNSVFRLQFETWKHAYQFQEAIIGYKVIDDFRGVIVTIVEKPKRIFWEEQKTIWIGRIHLWFPSKASSMVPPSPFSDSHKSSNFETHPSAMTPNVTGQLEMVASSSTSSTQSTSLQSYGSDHSNMTRPSIIYSSIESVAGASNSDWAADSDLNTDSTIKKVQMPLFPCSVMFLEPDMNRSGSVDDHVMLKVSLKNYSARASTNLCHCTPKASITCVHSEFTGSKKFLDTDLSKFSLASLGAFHREKDLVNEATIISVGLKFGSPQDKERFDRISLELCRLWELRTGKYEVAKMGSKDDTEARWNNITRLSSTYQEEEDHIIRGLQQLSISRPDAKSTIEEDLKTKQVTQPSDHAVLNSNLGLESKISSSIAPLSLHEEDDDSSDFGSTDNSDVGEPTTSFGNNRNAILRNPGQNRLRQIADNDRQYSRVGHLRRYYTALSCLKQEVNENSVVHMLLESSKHLYNYNNESSHLSSALTDEAEKTHLWITNKIHIPDLHDWVSNAGGNTLPGQDEDIKVSLLALLECRDILFIIQENLRRMELAKFVSEEIKILVVHESRTSVARLRSIPFFAITTLTQTFETVLARLTERWPSRFFSRGAEGEKAQLTIYCSTLLKDLGFNYHAEAKRVATWYTLVSFLDLAVVAYANALVEDFELPGMKAEDGVFLIPSIRGNKLEPQIKLERYSTSCLDTFFDNQKMWVFSDIHVSIDGPLYVSGTIEDISDLWGPIWGEESETVGTISHFEAGSGRLVPWQHDYSLHPTLARDEQLCHWVSNETEEVLQNDLLPASPNLRDSKPLHLPFKPNTKLLIGARQRRQPMEWRACRCDIAMIEQKLRGTNRLQQLGTKGSYTYVESREVQLLGGSNGFSIGGTMTIKRAKGVMFKELFLDFWERQPQSRDPRDLSNLWGIAISLCTFNSERVSVFELLNTPSMQRFLSRYAWTEVERKDKFTQSLESGDINSLCTLWDDNPDWQKELGTVLLTCFRALSHTGYDNNRKDFSALWVSPDSNLPKRIILHPSEHSWIRFLRNSEVSFAVAVVVEECLGARFPQGRRRCNDKSGASALHTSICINEAIEPTIPRRYLVRPQSTVQNVPREKWSWKWDVSALESGVCFPLGSQGRLKTIAVLTPSRLLLSWDVVWRDAIRKIAGMERAHGATHWEYTEVNDPSEVRPIPIYLQSSRNETVEPVKLIEAAVLPNS